MKKYLSFLFIVFVILVSVTSAQSANGDIKLQIDEGVSCCVYGQSLDFGTKAISFSGYVFTGDFISTMGTSRWTCSDMHGVETGWTMVLQMGSPLTNDTNNTIPNQNVKVSYGNTSLVGGNCVAYTHSGVDQSMDNPVILLEKDGNVVSNYGRICALQTPSVKMKVDIGPAQAPGRYTGVLIIDIPNFMGTCDANQILQGAFYDSAIQGLSYSGNMGSSGTTTSGGYFNYRLGEKITFSIGTVALGTVFPEWQRRVFLPEVFGKDKSNLNDSQVVKSAKLLQSLDQDGNPSNGITIVPSVAAQITGTLTGLDVNQKLVQLGITGKTDTQVLQHLEQTLLTTFQETSVVSYPWAVRGGGTSADNYYGSVVDLSGNVYAVGYFQGTATFGSKTLVSSGGNDVLLTKFDDQGNYLWSIKGGGILGDGALSLTLDASGYPLVAGRYSGSVTFGAFSLTGGFSSFLAKADLSGNWISVKKIATNAEVWGISKDYSGNIYVAGYCASGANFGGPRYDCPKSNVFLVKYDANGNFIWEKYFLSIFNIAGGTIATWIPAVDKYNNVYLAGHFSGSIIYDSGYNSGITGMRYDGFVVKYSSSGDFLWSRQITGGENQYITSLTLDNSDNIYLGATLTSGSWFGPFYLGITTPYSDVAVAKLSSTGQWLWATVATGAGSQFSTNITYNLSTDKAFFLGYTDGGPVYFGDYLSYSIGGWDLMFAEFNPLNGQWIYATRYGSASYDYAYGLTTDSLDNVYIAGNTNSSPLTIGGVVLTGRGGYDAFVKKIVPGERY